MSISVSNKINCVLHVVNPTDLLTKAWFSGRNNKLRKTTRILTNEDFWQTDEKGREGENGANNGDELQTRARAHPPCLEMGVTVGGGGGGVAVKSCKKCERISAGKRDWEQAEWTGRWDIYEPVGFVLATLAPSHQLSYCAKAEWDERLLGISCIRI